MKKAFLIVGFLVLIFGIVKLGFQIPQLSKFTPELAGQELGYNMGYSIGFYIGPILFILVGSFLVYQGLKKEKE